MTLSPSRFALALSSWAAAAPAQVTAEIVREYLWPADPKAIEDASARLSSTPRIEGVSREEMRGIETMMPQRPFAEGEARGGAGEEIQEIVVPVPGGRKVPVFVRLPSTYQTGRRWPLMFAMHGGPPGSEEGARQGALRMISVWEEAAEAAGWIVVAPAMVDVVSRDGRTEDRLPYEIFHPEEARAVLDTLARRFSVDPDRIVSTGISLGSNFSIAFAAAHPDWFSAIVPVSTEGDSREHVLRNLAPVPVYVLEGARDQNIRTVSGPRALERILTSFDYDLVYREFAERAHEGFQERYPDVLRWLEERPRRRAPREVLRVPHRGIAGVARRIHWVETDTRQALVRARVVSPHEIEVTARWAGEVRLFPSEALVDLDRPLTVRVNGEVAHRGPVARSEAVDRDAPRASGDGDGAPAAPLALHVPGGPDALRQGVELWEELAPTHAEGPLSFWEMYAVRAIEERFPSVGFDGVEVPLPASVKPTPEQVALRVTGVEPTGPAARAGLEPGDVLVSFGGEPFFAGRGGATGLHHWLVRELRTHPTEYELVVWRDGRRLALHAMYALGPYRAEG